MQHKGSTILKILKNTGAALLITISFVLLLALILINPIAERLLQYTVKSKSNGLYSLSIERTRLNPFSGNILLENVGLHPHPAQYQQQGQVKEMPAQLLDVTFKQLKIEQLSWLQFLLTKKLEINAINLTRPEISITQHNKQAKKQATSQPNNSSSDKLKYVNIAQLNITDGHITIHHQDQVSNKSQEAHHLHLSLKGLIADFSTQQDLRQSLSAQQLTLGLEDYALHLPDSIFTIKVGRFSYSSTDQMLLAEKVLLDANSEQNNKLEATQIDSAYKYLYHISLPRLQIDRANLLQAWSQQELSLGTILFDQPEIKVINYVNVPKSQSDTAKVDYAHLHKYVKKAFQKITVNQLKIRDAQFAMAEKDQAPVIKHSARSVSFQADSIRIDSTIADKPQKIYYAQDVFLQVKEGAADLPQDMYSLQVGSFTACSKQELVETKQMQLIPRLSKKAFVKKLQYRTDRVELENETIRVTGIKIGPLLLDKKLIAEAIDIENTRVNLFRDMTPPLKKEEKPLLHQALQQLPLEIIISQARIKNANIRYEELPKQGLQPGFITFEDLYTTLHNITNSPAVLRQQNKLALQVQTKLYGKSKLEASLLFPLDDPSGRYTMEGQLHSIDAATFNQILIPLAQVKITNGTIQKAAFEMISDNNQAKGDLDLYYKNLQLELTNKRGEDTGLLKDAASALINMLAVKSDNLPGENYQEGSIEAKRKKNTSIFNHWARSFINGVISSMTTEPVESITEEVVGN